MRKGGERSVKTKLILAAAATLFVVLAGLGYARWQCPGKIVCPLTGQTICVLLCPAK